jgi:hypothetical protein
MCRSTRFVQHRFEVIAERGDGRGRHFLGMPPLRALIA